MSLLIAAVVVFGFSHTVDHNLIHAAPVRPWILWLHGAVFAGWVVFFILQSALVRVHQVRLHRTLGWFGLGLGATIPILGVATVLCMVRFKTLVLHSPDAAPFISIPLCDLACFTIPFVLAMIWRKKPELHRRLILLASIALTNAAFARFPTSLLPHDWFYVGVDFLILLGVARDLLATRRIHPVYCCALPAFILAQSVALHLDLARPPYWLHFANAVTR